MTGRVQLSNFAFGTLLETTGRRGPVSGHFITDASGHHLTVEIGRSVFEERGHMACIARPDAEVLLLVDLTGASGHPELCPMKGYNGSISWGLLFKPHGRL